MAHLRDNDDDGAAFIGYNEWAREKLGVHLATDFVYDYDDGERGVFVAEDVAPQTVLLEIPERGLFTLAWIAVQREHPVYAHVPAFVRLQEDVAENKIKTHGWSGTDAIEIEDELLAVALLYETYVARDASPWAPHLARLPTTYHTPLYFTVEELEALRGSNAFYVAQEMRTRLQTDYDRVRRTTIGDLIEILSLDGSHGGIEALEEAFSWEHYRWAIATIWSRFVSIDMGNESEGNDDVEDGDCDDDDDTASRSTLKAMVPVFDMLNHNPAAEMVHRYDPMAKVFRVVSRQHWAAGTQVFINYGPLSNHKLLTLYGFVLPENPDDTVDVWLPMDEATTPLYEMKVAALEELGIDHEITPFELCEDEINELLLIVARIQALECDQPENFVAAIGQLAEGQVLNSANERNALSRLIYMLDKIKEQFQAPAEDRASDYSNDAAIHRRMAALLCESDLHILSENIEMLKWRLLEYLDVL